MSERPKILCPFCKKKFSQDANGIWPFCSEDCRAGDLGAWATERYKVAGKHKEESGELTSSDKVEVDQEDS